MLFQNFQKIVVAPTCQIHGNSVAIQQLCIHPDGDCDPRICHICDENSQSQGLHVHGDNGEMKVLKTKTLNRLLVDHSGENLCELISEAEKQFEKAIRKTQRGLDDLVVDYKRCILAIRGTIKKNNDFFFEIQSLRSNLWEDFRCQDIRRLKESLQKKGYYENMNNVTRSVINMREQIGEKLNEFSKQVKTAKRMLRLAMLNHSALSQGRDQAERNKILNLTKEINKNVQDHIGYFNRAYQLANMKSDPIVTETNYRYCLDLNVSYSYAYNNIGTIRDRDQKLQLFSVSALVGSQLQRISLNNYGRQLLFASNFSKAEQFCKKALQVQATYDIHQNLAAIYKETGRFQQAVQQLTSAIALSPKLPILYTLRAEVHQLIGKPQEAKADGQYAEQILKNSWRLFPDSDK